MVTPLIKFMFMVLFNRFYRILILLKIISVELPTQVAYNKISITFHSMHIGIKVYNDMKHTSIFNSFTTPLGNLLHKQWP